VQRQAAYGAAYSARGRWFCANHAGLTRAYPVAWFTGKLVSLATRWDELNLRQRFGYCSRGLKLDTQGMVGSKGKVVESEIEMGRLPAGGESQ